MHYVYALKHALCTPAHTHTHMYTYITFLLIPALCTTLYTGQAQFYSCPPLTGDTAGICVQECTDDSNCSDSKRCCSNGCGMTCQTPVAIPYVVLTEAASCPPTNEVPCVKRIGGSCRDPAYPCGDGWMCCDNDCTSAACMRVSELQPCLKARSIVRGNATTPLLGAYSPRCDADGRFRELQCLERYCWCVDNVTGRPLSDMVAYDDLGKLKCAGECACVRVHLLRV